MFRCAAAMNVIAALQLQRSSLLRSCNRSCGAAATFVKYQSPETIKPQRGVTKKNLSCVDFVELSFASVRG